MLSNFKATNFAQFFKDVKAIPCNPKTDNGSDYFGYIAKYNPPLEFSLSKIVLPENPKIVDLGCGYCEVLLYLKSLIPDSQAHGVEFNETYNQHIQELIQEHNLGITVHNEDILNHDISSYDLIYTFCPAMSHVAYEELNTYIANNMKVGAYWIEVHNICVEDKSELVELIDSRFEIISNNEISRLLILKKIS